MHTHTYTHTDTHTHAYTHAEPPVRPASAAAGSLRHQVPPPHAHHSASTHTLETVAAMGASQVCGVYVRVCVCVCVCVACMYVRVCVCECSDEYVGRVSVVNVLCFELSMCVVSFESDAVWVCGVRNLSIVAPCNLKMHQVCTHIPHTRTHKCTHMCTCSHKYYITPTYIHRPSSSTPAVLACPPPSPTTVEAAPPTFAVACGTSTASAPLPTTTTVTTQVCACVYVNDSPINHNSNNAGVCVCV